MRIDKRSCTTLAVSANVIPAKAGTQVAAPQDRGLGVEPTSVCSVAARPLTDPVLQRELGPSLRRGDVYG